jgi:hypothetical protein
MRIKTRSFLAFLFVRGTARFSRGVSFAAPGVLFSLNPRGLVSAVRVGGKWRAFYRVWAPVAEVAA